MDKPLPSYHSYLLRLWRADNAGQPVCRVSLEEPGSRKQIHFDSLPALCAYLAEQARLTAYEKPVNAQNQAGEA